MGSVFFISLKQNPYRKKKCSSRTRQKQKKSFAVGTVYCGFVVVVAPVSPWVGIALFFIRIICVPLNVSSILTNSHAKSTPPRIYISIRNNHNKCIVLVLIGLWTTKGAHQYQYGRIGPDDSTKQKKNRWLSNWFVWSENVLLTSIRVENGWRQRILVALF